MIFEFAVSAIISKTTTFNWEHVFFWSGMAREVKGVKDDFNSL